MINLSIIIGITLIVYLIVIILQGIRYYRQLPQDKKDWINNPKMTFSEWHKGFKFWRYMNIPDDGNNIEFTKLNKMIRPLAKKYLIVNIIVYILLVIAILQLY
jgi:hypothetical protein